MPVESNIPKSRMNPEFPFPGNKTVYEETSHYWNQTIPYMHTELYVPRTEYSLNYDTFRPPPPNKTCPFVMTRENLL